MAALTAEDIVRLFEEDSRARKRLAELLVSGPDVRLAVVNAVARDVAARHDLRGLESRMEGGFSRLEVGVDGLEAEVSALRGRVSGLEGAVSRLAERIGDLGGRIDVLDGGIDALDKRIDFVAKITVILAGSVVATLVASIVLRMLGLTATQPPPPIWGSARPCSLALLVQPPGAGSRTPGTRLGPLRVSRVWWRIYVFEEV